MKHIEELMSGLDKAITMSDNERRDIFMIAETFSSLVELAEGIVATEESKDKMEQLIKSLTDLKFVLKSRSENRVFEFDFEQG